MTTKEIQNVVSGFVFDDFDMYFSGMLDNVVVKDCGDELICNDEEATEIIADFLDSLGLVTCTGYYDPEEDTRNNEVDDRTGWWYITY